jgi:uncharacterized membrane protein YeaQ/YmgE (transglycosylase-associated protein family)
MLVVAFLLFVISGCCCAWTAERIVPKRIPGGFFTACMIGIVGAWMGSHLLGKFGPAIGEVPLMPTVLGSILFVFLLAFIAEISHPSKT